MSVFTTVSEPELTGWLNDYSLGQLLELQGIASGIDNTNYFVTTSNGRFVLTLFEKLTSGELPFYLDLMFYLARHGIPCPSPVADRYNRFFGELNGKPACIVSCLPGKSLTQADSMHCAAVGAVLGQMHIAGQGFAKTKPNPRASEWRLRTAQQVKPFLPQQEAALLDSEITFHAQHTLAALPQGIIHADLFRDNVLFDGAHISGLIDFYFACNDSLLYDVAITVNDWCMDADGVLDEARTQALLRAYHAVRSFQPEEHLVWHIALRAAALRFWLSRLFNLYLPREGDLVHTRDPEQFKRILQHRIAAGGNVVWL